MEQDRQNILTIGGVPMDALAERTGTPVFVYDEDAIRRRLAAFQAALRDPDFETQVLYASKAFSCGAIFRLAAEAGCSLDVVSGGELHCAKTSGFPMERVYFHGNNKTPEELEMAFDCAIGAIVIDNPMECHAVLALAARRKQTMALLLRVNPGVEAHTHHYIVTAHPDSKFGMNSENRQEIFALARAIRENGYARFSGFHAHIGSQIFQEEPFRAEIRKLAELAEALEREEGIPVETFNLGGGFAAYYADGDAPLPIEQACGTILAACREEKSRKRLCLKRIQIEPGRSVVAEAGCTLYRVGFRKQTDCKSYVFVDGGMADNIRPALYGAKYSCCLANRLEEAPAGTYTIAGKCCESGDILIEDAPLPEPRRGDLLAVFTTGAYGYSMASNYNRLGRPPVVFVKDGKARLALRRESYEDMGQLESQEEIYM